MIFYINDLTTLQTFYILLIIFVSCFISIKLKMPFIAWMIGIGTSEFLIYKFFGV